MTIPPEIQKRADEMAQRAADERKDDMKTAEEWANTYPALEVFWVKQIQLDAYKAGMSEAARMCCASTKEESSRLWELRAITQAENKKAHELSDAILTVRDNKTVL